MSFKVRPLNEMIPIIMDAIKDDYDLPIHKELPATESPMILKIKEQHNRIKILEEALRDILAIPNSEAAQGIMKVIAKAALASAGEGVVATTADYERWLGDLLAIIHRDGGEYLSLHGPKKAVADAHLVWAKLQLAADPTPPPPTGEAQS